MSIHVALNHKTHYRYDRPVAHSPHIIRLRPAPHCRTPILSYSQHILPEKHFLNWQQDPFSNFLARLAIPDKTNELLVEIDLVAEMAVFNPFDFFLEPAAEKFPFQYEPWLKKELGPFLETAPPTPLLKEYLQTLDLTEGRTVDFLVQVNQRLWRDIKYLIRLEPGVQEAETSLKKRCGSCRDSAWLFVQILRQVGLAARFVSGYLIQLTPDVKSLDGPSGADVDFSDLHAWTEVYLPGAGWVGLDPTSGLFAGEGHIPLACSPEPTGAAPVTGSVDKCESEFTHEMKVTRIHESPRVTKPYTEEQWQEIESLGHKIDSELKKNDVRLTMGGEPTFISIDDMDGEEWNFTAVGPEKRRLSGELIRRMKRKFAPGGLLHYGQGKWYPGESLPRWALACYWRKDGQVIWQDDELFANEAVDYGHTEKEAEQFITQLARILEVKPKHVLPAYEDAWYYMWRERQLPTNVDPLQSRLEDKEERARLAKIFDQGLNKVAGYVLPLERQLTDRSRWKSGPWFLRPEHLFLLPGDSPIGLRLPLDSIPWVSRSDYPYINPPDPMTELPPLPNRAQLRKGQRAQFHPPQQFISETPGRTATSAARQLEESLRAEQNERAPARSQSADWIVRTALCVEPREGRLHIFMPPIRTSEDYLELISAIEETATELKLPVIIEGAAPPHDHRVDHIKVTPDPGVIEVNLHPAHSWDELVDNTTTLYEEARQTRLGAEKFMIDGRHVGTGGGNHVVIGGPTAADSPILRKPELLASLLRYWQNHPSLSFLFSGLFIGPTSQHPRVDEARNDSLYELELACKQIPEAADVPPWLVDRLFRDLLVDATGNTHRAEFCIDKLYSPDSSSGRLGLVELRAFEMPPHARMSLTQQLLLRSLIARFWQQPYEQKLVRWGTELHDRFMLPHFVEQDFHDVIEDMQMAGYPLQPEWFAPHMEFRFPVCGTITQRGLVLEVRQALEPWHVLGEEGASGATVRYVDSSLERLQVKVRGMTDTRHQLACNGHAVPLHPTGTEGEYVAGIRFRAWQPPQCLHPTIGVHAPLTFDLVDSWNQRSIGGCTYHVSHPGGLSYSKLPVNAYEAESRRLTRFFKFGHTPGPMCLAEPERNPEFPFTLDLRCAPLPPRKE
ncbi:MAG TPA: transglutaminase family protein [Verrucomicrobiae bacterium]|nr:transglutaminase family protein [Verrucomicrobiae bacterium]